MDKIEKIIIHCSDSEFGNFEMVDNWHKEFGWEGFGYHFLIENGYYSYGSAYKKDQDGMVITGRSENEEGAHCLGHNQNSLGICLIGCRRFTDIQLLISLPALLSKLLPKYELSMDAVFGHGEINNNKSCPNFDMPNYRFYLKKMFNNRF